MCYSSVEHAAFLRIQDVIPHVITVTWTHGICRATCASLGFLHHNRRARVACPLVQGGCSPLTSALSLPHFELLLQAKDATNGEFCKIHLGWGWGSGGEEKRNRRIIKFHLQGAFSWRPTQGGGVLLFYIAVNCWVGHLPAFRRQLHKSFFFSWNLGSLLMCDLQQQLPINAVGLFTVRH